MPELFQKTWINSLEMPNRAVRSATWTGTGDEQGYVTDRTVEFYRELGSGGIGLIVTGYLYVMPNGKQLPFQIGNYDDSQIEGLARLADTVHAAGGRIIPQIVHVGSRANPRLIPEGDEIWAPSAIADSGTRQVPKEMTLDDIRRLVEAYAAAAARSLKAGFDGVQLHGAHGYGINQFLSGAWNIRGDVYGGTIKQRYRFLGEVLEAVRGAVGPHFPVLIKLNAEDYVERGLTIAESVEVAKRLDQDGIDAIEVSGGCAAAATDKSPARTKIEKSEDEAYLLEFAAAIKEAVKVPVITVGGIRSLKKIDAILTNRWADYVAMARPFIREPGLVNRWKEGDTSKAKCISCNGCFETGHQGIGTSCKVERALREKRQTAD